MASRADNYRAKAAECEKQAHRARDEIMKGVCEDVARSWIRLATFLDDSAANRSPPFSCELQSDDRASTSKPSGCCLPGA
jgi:hypothetical protein